MSKESNKESQPERVKPNPLAYLITFTCYGTHLHGDERGSVDREHNIFRTPFLPQNPARVCSEEKRAKQEPSELDSQQRALVLESILEVCSYRGWELLAAHVRSSHVHMVVVAEESPERILHDVKAYASRALNQSGLDESSGPRWTRHGSTRYLWKPEQIGAAIHYVFREQGEPMAVWEKREGLP